MITFPNAKINIGLHVVERCPNGYHNLETVFYPVPLEDALEITPIYDPDGCTVLHQSGIAIDGLPEDNLVMKAYRMLNERFGLPPVAIHLYKHIPSGAGLGGGSSDAAFMLKLLNSTFSIGLSANELELYAAELGADCAFFIRNQPTFAEGIGNVFSPLHLSLKGFYLALVKPDVFVSTKAAFSNIKPRCPEHPLKETVNLPINQWKSFIINDFEESVFPQYPQIKEIKETLYEQGALYAAMSGSGSSVYGIFDKRPALKGYNNHFYFECRL